MNMVKEDMHHTAPVNGYVSFGDENCVCENCTTNKGEPKREGWEKEFEKKFPDRIARVIDDFGDTTKSDIKSFIQSILDPQLERIEANIYEQLKPNDGFEYTEEFIAGMEEAVSIINQEKKNMSMERKIAEPEEICFSPKHEPSTMVHRTPGTYEHTCPSCGKRIVFEVPQVIC